MTTNKNIRVLTVVFITYLGFCGTMRAANFPEEVLFQDWLNTTLLTPEADVLSSLDDNTSNIFGDHGILVENLLLQEEVAAERYCERPVAVPLLSPAQENKKMSQKRKRERPEPLQSENIYCNLCNTSSSNTQALKIHIIRKHAQHLKPFVCSWCYDFAGNQKAFATRGEYKTHLTKHHDQGEMDIIRDKNKAQEVKKMADDMIRGQQLCKRDVSKPVKFICSVDRCGRSFSSKCGLSKHQNVHNKKPYKCKECGNVFDNKLACKRHVSKHLSYLQPFVCVECKKLKLCMNKAFVQKESLKIHLEIHHNIVNDRIVADPRIVKQRKQQSALLMVPL